MTRCRGLAIASVTAVLCILTSVCARADVYVIVNAKNPAASMTKREATDIFMGRVHNFPSGDFALPLDLPRESGGRASFYKLLTGNDLTQINSYWARLMFGGQTMPPQPMRDEAAMINVVARNQSAIGYVAKAPTGTDVRVVLILTAEAPSK